MKRWRSADTKLRNSILKAREHINQVETPDNILRDCAALCIALGSDGLRGELILLKAARALAAFEAAPAITRNHLRQVAPSALRHRLRRDPLDDAGSTTRVNKVIEDVLE